jgi:poly-gamma-glutamate capsule biosynthesis protein CapA/YwtB (metallophosphatase superfamily)
MDRRTFLKVVARTTAAAGAARWAPAGADGMGAAAAAEPAAPATPATPAAAGPPAAAGTGLSAGSPRGTGVSPGPTAAEGRFTLVGAGDCIITRRVSELTHPDFHALVEVLRGADCAWGNCEIVIGKGGELHPAWKGGDPHVCGDPWTADELRWMGFTLMGTANNHTVDYGEQGLISTLENLDRVGIAHAGSGLALEEAARPGYADSAAGRVGLVSCASTFPPYFAAAPAHPYVKGRPGLNPLNVKATVVLDDATFQRLKAARQVLAELWAENDDQGLGGAKPPADPKKLDLCDEYVIRDGDHVDYQSEGDAGDVKRVGEAIAAARGESRVVVASIHAHEARRKHELSDLFIQPFAHACIDAGADIYFSSGPHVLRGIELYKGKPIFYSLANFFFQVETHRDTPAEDFTSWGLDSRTLDPLAFENKIGFIKQQRYWRSVAPRITFEGGKVTAVELFPLALGFDEPADRRGTPRLARGQEAAAILEHLASLSAPYGTVVEVDGEVGRLRLG